MKLIGFWLLVLVAVLVPATASIATSLICPTLSTAKVQATQATQATHMAAASRHVAAYNTPSKAQAARKSAAPSPTTGHCCDYTPCSQCAGCSSCASMAVMAPLGAEVLAQGIALLPEGGGPRAEFLLSGQERPPRIG